VGIRRAAIFYHFQDKHALYAAVLDEVLDGAMRALPSKGSAAERLEASLVGWIDYVAQRPSVARLFLREAANAQPGVVSPLWCAARPPGGGCGAGSEGGGGGGDVNPPADPHRFMSLMGATTVFHFA